ncbi:unnamed protein product [Caenorhabditis sp. 36 PRJEB53466]|nr:unnamed protein product [Caenorhabditis sp. 36 PRJEB53466]
MLLLNRFLLFSSFSCSILAEHVTVTYQFWDKDLKIAEKAEFFAKFLATSNRFWTTNFVAEQHDEKIDRIRISSENWKGASVEENVTNSLDQVFVSLFQKFADKLYTNYALDSKPVFDPSVFHRHHYAYQSHEIGTTEQVWFDSDDGSKQKFHYTLWFVKTTFDHWEAVLQFLDALKKTHLKGAIVDCERQQTLCVDLDMSRPILAAHNAENNELYKYYDGDFRKDHLHDWMLTVQLPEISILTENNVPYWRDGIIPGFDRPRDTVTILFTDTKKSQIWRNYKKYAKSVHGYMHLAAVVNKDVQKWSFHPAFITMKPQDAHNKAFTLYKDITFDRMADFLEDGWHPSCHSLTSASEFLTATGDKKKPLLLFFDPLGSKNVTQFQFHAAHAQVDRRIAHFAAVTGFDLFGLYLSSVFHVETAQYVVVQRLEKGWCLHTKPIEEDDFVRTLRWVEDLKPFNCQEVIEDFKFPIGRLDLLERFEDLEELEREFTTVEKTRDEL